jgi:hypothetical protein
MAERSAIQQEMEFFGMDWYDPTCYAWHMPWYWRDPYPS